MIGTALPRGASDWYPWTEDATNLFQLQGVPPQEIHRLVGGSQPLIIERPKHAILKLKPAAVTPKSKYCPWPLVDTPRPFLRGWKHLTHGVKGHSILVY